MQSEEPQQVPAKQSPPQQSCPPPQECVASHATHAREGTSQTSVPKAPVGVPQVPGVRHSTQRFVAGSHAFEAQSAPAQHSASSTRGGPPGVTHPPPQQVLPVAHGAVVGSQLPQARLAKLHARCFGFEPPSQARLFVALGQHSVPAMHVGPAVGASQQDWEVRQSLPPTVQVPHT